MFFYVFYAMQNHKNAYCNIIQNMSFFIKPIFFGSSNIEMGKKWYENIIFSFIYAIISMKVIY